MVREEMAAAKAAGGGFVVDGIPRNMHQARAAYLIGRVLQMTADVALHLHADDAGLMRRLLARAALEHRSDDTPEVIAQRLGLYQEVTSPVLAWYRDRGILVCVDAMRSAQQVGREILAAVQAMRPFLGLVPEQARLPVDLTGLGERLASPAPAPAHPAEPSARPPGWASAAWRLPDIRHCATCPGAAGGYSSGLDGRCASTWTTRRGPARRARYTRDRLPPPDPAEPRG
jgi:hypothetical protein